MIEHLEIRSSTPADEPTLEWLYRDAFPSEDLLPLVRALLPHKAVLYSLVGIMQGRVIGHVVFTACGVEGVDVKAALLAPLGIVSDLQRQGLGGAIVRHALKRLEADGISHVFVLGDPNYYRRFGFAAEDAVTPPYPLPDAWSGAWQSLRLGDADPLAAGALSVPKPWRRRALWVS